MTGYNYGGRGIFYVRAGRSELNSDRQARETAKIKTRAAFMSLTIESFI